MSWCTIESDPGFFTELIANLGVKDTDVEEIWSLDESSITEDQIPSYGLIFLFKWRQEVDERQIIEPCNMPDLFFARQIVNNACATQAILSILLNTEEEILGEELSNLKSFTMPLDCESKGIAIGNSDHLRIVHNAFAKPEPFQADDETKVKSTTGEDVYHFIAYLPFKGKVYELDGLKSGPIEIGGIESGSDWLSIARPAVQARMSRYSASETHFALLSIQPKRSTRLEREIDALQSSLDGVMSLEKTSLVQTKISELRLKLEDELASQERQRQENIRRRHNYVPFAIALLRALSKKGKLQPMIEKAKANPKK